MTSRIETETTILAMIDETDNLHDLLVSTCLNKWRAAYTFSLLKLLFTFWKNFVDNRFVLESAHFLSEIIYRTCENW